LIVEDNQLNQKICCMILERAGFEIAVAENGQLAIDHVIAQPCDLILMDCQMPVMDGFESTRIIRQLEADGRLAAGCRWPLPIIAVTANAMAGDREKCMGAGMNEYVTKPVVPGKLIASIEALLRVPRA
jgi:CheY-like chemotaxis protein